MKKYLYLIGPIALGIFFLTILPLFIQGGDTAELVNASYHLYVPHPPGYPLFMWSEFIWTHVFAVSTVFWRASLLSGIFGLVAVGLLSYSLRKNIILAFIPVLLFGLNMEFIESSVLPDVFSLHALLLSIFAYVYLIMAEEKRRFYLIPIIFFLSSANHHTTIFLLPCLLQALHEAKKKAFLKEYITGALIGVVISLGLYLSLFFCQTKSAFSWGELTSITALIGHVLRVDYGTFKLASNNEASGIGPFMLLMKTLLPYLPVLIISSYILFRQKVFSSKILSWVICFLIVLLFPLIMNITPEGVGVEVLKRFHIMPLMLLSYLIVMGLKEMKSSILPMLLLTLSLIPALFINFTHLPHFFNLRNDSVIEDYSKLLYQNSKKYAPALVMADNDSSYFGFRYIQAFDDEKKEVAVATAELFFHPWYLPKIKSLIPGFTLPNSTTIYRKRTLNVSDDIVKPNLEKINFVMIKDYKGDSWYEITFLNLGRLIQNGTGINFLEDEIPLGPVPDDKGPQFYTKNYLYYQYSHFYLAKALVAFEKGEIDEATKFWEKAIEVVPYAYPPMANLCSLSTEREYCKPSLLEYFKNRTKGFY
jgi:hypothetical protein